MTNAYLLELMFITKPGRWNPGYASAQHHSTYGWGLSRQIWTPRFLFPPVQMFKVFGPPVQIFQKYMDPSWNIWTPLVWIPSMHAVDQKLPGLWYNQVTTRMLIWLARKATFAVAAASLQVHFLKHSICNVSSALISLSLSLIRTLLISTGKFAS